MASRGTGSIRNAANTGGINPLTGVEVNAVEGDEYVAHLTFDPAVLTLVEAPEPEGALLGALAVALLAGRVAMGARRVRG